MEGVPHIAIDGIRGGDYTLALQLDDVKKRKRIQKGEKACGTVTEANDKLFTDPLTGDRRVSHPAREGDPRANLSTSQNGYF